MTAKLFASFDEARAETRPEVPPHERPDTIAWPREVFAGCRIGALQTFDSAPFVLSRETETQQRIGVRVDLKLDSPGLDLAVSKAVEMGVTDLGLHAPSRAGFDRFIESVDARSVKLRLRFVNSRDGPGPVDPLTSLVGIAHDLAPKPNGGRADLETNTVEVVLPACGRFYDDIARLRALRAVYAAFTEPNEGAGRSDLVVTLRSELLPSVEDADLSNAATAAASAFFGGATTVAFRPIPDNDIRVVERFAALQHVLLLESKVADDESVVAGSCYVERLTQAFLSATLEAIGYPFQPGSQQHEGGVGRRLSAMVERSFVEQPSHTKYLGASGVEPFLRGPYPSMYNGRPWTIRQYAGFSTALASNAFYRRNLAAGQKGLSVAFDLPTHRGYDSDHPRVVGDVGKAGVAIDTVEDMKILFDGIPLDTMSVSMTMNGAVLPILAFYIVAAEERGIPPEQLAGTVQNDILKEFMVRNTYIYPPGPSMRIVGDILRFASERMPRYNPLSISGYHMQEAGATAGIELGYTLANGLEYVRSGLSAGLRIDDFAPRLSFFFGIGMDFAREVAKLRAARWLWASLMRSFEPKDPRSLMLRTHCQTSGWSLSAVDNYNNVARTCIEALAAVSGHTQSLHTNALDEAVALPTDRTAAIARETQLQLQADASIIHAIDPWGGSRLIERLTEEIAEEARTILEEVEGAGGMTSAIEKGIPKRRIEEAAAQRQAAIDTGAEKVVGLNCYRTGRNGSSDYLEVDNRAVREAQRESVNRVKSSRSSEAVTESLDRLTAAAVGEANLVEACLDAARCRATLGEISYALEKVFGRYDKNPAVVSGIYGAGARGNAQFEEARRRTAAFADRTGRRPRILIAKLGQDGHDRGARVVASAFADLGFDVDIGPLFQTPEEAARQAVDNDVHVLGVSSLAGGHKTLVPAARRALDDLGRPDILIALGGVIPAADFNELKTAGTSAVFGPGTVVAEAALELLELIAAPAAS